jgi:uncharacterized RDD family membrane protein YckC
MLAYCLSVVLLVAGVLSSAQAKSTTSPTTAASPQSATTQQVAPLSGRTLLTEAGPGTYWLITRQRDEQQPERVVTLVRMTERGIGKLPRWQHVTRLSRSPVQVAAIDRRLALLFADHSWQLVWPGSVSQGPTMPEGRTLVTIASKGASMVALARSNESLELWEFNSGWQKIGVLDGVKPDGEFALAALTGGWFVVAQIQEEQVSLNLRERDGTWTPLPKIEGDEHEVEWVRVLTSTSPAVVVKRVNRPAQLMVLSDNSGAKKWVEEAALPTPKPVAGLRTSLAEIDGELRLAWVENDSAYELAFSPQGKPVSSGPTVLSMPPDPNRVSLWQSAMTLAMLGLLAVALVSTAWRPPPVVDEQSVLPAVASHTKRFIAGVIDAAPVIFTVFWIAFDAQSRGQDPAMGLSGRQELLFGIGLLVYIVWTTVAEVVTGRSVGKWLLGLDVVDAQGNRPRVGAIVLRNAMRLLDIYLLPLLLVFMTPLRQRLGDIASQTFVIERAKRPAPPITTPPDDPTKPGPG